MKVKPVKKCCFNCFYSRHFYVAGEVLCFAENKKIAEDEGDPILLKNCCDKFEKRDEDDDIGNTLM